MERGAQSRREAALGGCALGLAYTLPLLCVLGLPLGLGLGLALFLSVLWSVVALGWFALRRLPPVAAALGAGAVLVLVEWADYTLVPVWGTAQCFARVWSAAPAAAQIVRLGGIGAVVFVLAATQALAVKLALHRPRKQAAAALCALLVATALYDVHAWRRPSTGRVQVAAMGWTSAQLHARGIHDSGQVLRQVIDPLVAEAAHRGARLVVTPEGSLHLDASTRDTAFAELASLAARHQVELVVGYIDRQRNENRLAFFDPRGRLAGTYVKRHLVGYAEHFHTGHGWTVVDGPTGLRLGGMICQDDNFLDVARGYGERAVALVAVPTNDWAQVEQYHLENALFRALENGYGVVRAASNGVSAIVSARGEVLARHDALADGAPQLIVAGLPVYTAGRTPATLYAAVGDWLPIACALGLLALLMMGLRRGGTR